WPRATPGATTPALAGASPGAQARAARSRWSVARGRMRGWPAATSSRPTTCARSRPTCCATACCPATKRPPRAGTANAWWPNCSRGCHCPDGHVLMDTAGVVPTLEELVALRAAAQGRGLAQRGRHGSSGQAPSPLRGRGMEYAESREYAAGDDARHIDWRLTARSGKAHTKLFQAERER